MAHHDANGTLVAVRGSPLNSGANGLLRSLDGLSIPRAPAGFVNAGRVLSIRPMALSRSEQMSRIRGKDTEPEQQLRAALWERGLRYHAQGKTPVGRPDVVFLAERVAVFVDGCQWHGCPAHYVFPRTRRDFWGAKLAGNVARDRRQTIELEALGWRVVRVWEHEIFVAVEVVAALVAATLAGDAPQSAEAWRVVRVEPLPEGDDLERRHMEDLRRTEQQLVEVRRRSTRKWPRKTAPQ